VAIFTVTNDFLAQNGLQKEHLSELSSVLRELEGVELSLVLKEKEEGGAYRISARSKHYFDCTVLMAQFSGGGHARAAGGDNNSFGMPADFHRWMPTAHHDNPNIMSWIDEFLAIDMSNKGQYFGGRRHPRLLYIWGHSFEFDRKNNWEHMEEITDKLSGKEDIWYATNIEICDYTNAFYSLITNAEGNIVYNPTMIKIWFDVDGTTYSVAPGETLRIED
jgi:hypothetical protein